MPVASTRFVQSPFFPHRQIVNFSTMIFLFIEHHFGHCFRLSCPRSASRVATAVFTQPLLQLTKAVESFRFTSGHKYLKSAVCMLTCPFAIGRNRGIASVARSLR